MLQKHIKYFDLCSIASIYTMSKPVEKTQSPRQEVLNTISHAIAVPLGVAGFVYLWIHSTITEFHAQLGLTLYAVSFVLLFSASSMYHYIKNPHLKKKFRVLDHISIYYLIAGTYSPVVLIVLEESKGWFIFGLVWSVAFVGTLLKLFFTGKFEKLSLVLYLLMGWLIVIDIQNLIELASYHTLLYLSLGGLFYTIGAFFYANHKIRNNHVIWHIFVLIAAMFHFFMIAELVI